MPSMPGTHPATMSTDKGPQKQEAPTGTTNTDHEAALLDELWSEVPHNDPQTLKDGVLAIIRQLKREHEVEVDKIKAEHDHQTKLTRIDHLKLVVGLMEDIQKKEIAISEAQLEKNHLETLHDNEITNLKKEHQKVIQGYVEKEKKLEAEKETALRDKQIALGLQHNSLEESKTLAKEAEELRSKRSDLQQALGDANQKIETQKAHIANIEQKRGEEKEQLENAESELKKFEVMDRFLEGDNFLGDDTDRFPLSSAEIEWIIRVAAYGAEDIFRRAATSKSLIACSRRLAKEPDHDREEALAWRDTDFFECAHDFIAEIMELVQAKSYVRKSMANDARTFAQILDQS